MPKYELTLIKGSPRYYVVWSEGRRTKRVSTWTEDRGEAEHFKAEFILAKERKPESGPADVSLTDILTTYYEEHASNLVTAEQARIAIAHLLKFFGSSPASAVESGAHRKYEAMRRAAGVSFQTINRERMILRAALNHARKHHGLMIVPHVPTIAEGAAGNEKVEPRGRPLTLDELAALFNQAHEIHERRLLTFLLATLCRPGAAFDFQIEQADFKHKLIDLSPAGRPQTKKHRPIVPLPTFLLSEMRKAKTGHFITYHGHPILSAKKAFRRMRADAGLDKRVNPYSIRHTMARELRRRRVPAEQISLMLGHRPMGVKRTDLIYAPYEPGFCREAKRAIEAVWAALVRKLRASRPKKALRKSAKHARKPRSKR